MIAIQKHALAQGTRARIKSRAAQLSALAFSACLLANQAFAQVGGGTGTEDAVQARAVGVLSGFQGIMFAVGGVLLAAAFGWVGYGMAYGGKKWSDVANVCYGAGIAGMGAMIVGWIFS